MSRNACVSIRNAKSARWLSLWLRSAVMILGVGIMLEVSVGAEG